MVNTCLLYGVTNWGPINIIVILISLLIIAIVFSLSSIFSTSMRERIRAASKAELTQAFISVIILLVLAGVATTACTLSTTITKQLTNGQSMDPFGYAEYYVGNLATNTGINLLTTLYSTSVSYQVEAQVMQTFGALFNARIGKTVKTIAAGFGISGATTIVIAAAVHVAVLFSVLSSLYLTVISPIITLAIGILFIQFVMLPVFQYTAFSVVLPAAILMRSMAFMGNNLRYAANAVLAIAISLYIIYPLTIAFNGYVISWIYSSANPSYQYLQQTYLLPNIPISSYFSGLPSNTFTGFWGGLLQKLSPLLASTFSTTGFVITPNQVLAQAQYIVDLSAQFLFASIVLGVMDVAVVIGFATGLTKALNSGIEGAGSFWSGI